MSYTQEQGTSVWRCVVALHRALAREVRTVRFAHPDGTPAGEVRATPSHPFWVASQERYIALRDVREGERLLLLREDDFSLVDVGSITAEETPAPSFEVFNLSVEAPESSYFAAGVLVHNKEPVPQRCADGDVVAGAVITARDEATGETRHRLEVTLARAGKLYADGVGRREGSDEEVAVPGVTVVDQGDGKRWLVEARAGEGLRVGFELSGTMALADGSACGFGKRVEAE